MKRLRVLVLMHEDLVPPDQVNGHDLNTVEWRTEYDVVSTLKKLGHEVLPARRQERSRRDPFRHRKLEAGHRLQPTWKSSTAWPSMISMWCHTSNSCTCPTPAVIRAD